MRSILLVSSIVSLAFCRPELNTDQYRGSALGQIYPTQIPIQGQQQSYAGDQQQQSYNVNQQAYNVNQQAYNVNQQAYTAKQTYRSDNVFGQQQSYADKQQPYKAQNSYNQQQQYKGYTSQTKEVIPILAYSNDVAYDGSYNYNYETADGISRQESGVMTNPGTENEAQSVSGSYSYTAPDGTLITVTYTADANGFKAEGAHLPTPPPIPEAIAKSLEYIARTRAANPNAYQEEDGQYRPEPNYQQPFQKQFTQNRYQA